MHPLVEKFNNETEWKDKCLLLELIHIKMKLQFFAKKKKTWRIKDTANMLQVSIGAVSEDLQLAKAIANDLIGHVTSRNQAIKLIRQRRKNDDW